MIVLIFLFVWVVGIIPVVRYEYRIDNITKDSTNRAFGAWVIGVLWPVLYFVFGLCKAAYWIATSHQEKTS